MEREDDELQKQLERQMQAESDPTAVGGYNSFADPSAAGNPLGGSNTGVAGGKLKDVGVGSVGDSIGGVSTQPVGGAANVADPRAGYARTAAANNYKDIEGAGGLKTGGFMGGLEGFNTGGWGTEERGSNTHKNTFGKIASRYDPKQAGAAKAMMADPDFQAYFPDAKLVEHPNGDLIDFGDGRPVDVLRGAQAGGAGEAWQWGVDDGSGGGAGGGAPSASGVTVDSLMGGDPLAGIQSNLAGLVGGQEADEQTLIQQLLAQMGMQP